MLFVGAKIGMESVNSLASLLRYCRSLGVVARMMAFDFTAGCCCKDAEVPVCGAGCSDARYPMGASFHWLSNRTCANSAVSLTSASLDSDLPQVFLIVSTAASFPLMILLLAIMYVPIS